MNGLAQWGAFGFGLVIGWFLYLVNRYRKGDVQLGDITTVVAAIGGGAVTALFGPGREQLFGAYGIGLAVGFFTYFIVLLFMVGASRNFTIDYFLDGRRRHLGPSDFIPDYVRPSGMAMDATDGNG